MVSLRPPMEATSTANARCSGQAQFLRQPIVNQSASHCQEKRLNGVNSRSVEVFCLARVFVLMFAASPAGRRGRLISRWPRNRRGATEPPLRRAPSMSAAPAAQVMPSWARARRGQSSHHPTDGARGYGKINYGGQSGWIFRHNGEVGELTAALGGGRRAGAAQGTAKGIRAPAAAGSFGYGNPD